MARGPGHGRQVPRRSAHASDAGRVGARSRPDEAVSSDQRGAPRPRPRGSIGLLRDPVYGPFWAGKLLSTAGVWVHNVVAAVLVYRLTGSTVLVGAVSVGQFLPQLLFAPLSGAQADRGDPKRQLVVGRLVAAVGSGGLALALAAVGVDGLPGAWPVLASATIVGVGFVVGGPAMHSLVPTLVRPEELPTAVALNNLPPMIARSGGPVVGTYLLVAAGPAIAFGVAAAGNLLFAIVIALLPLARDDAPAAREDGTVRAGLRYLRQDPRIAFLLLGVLGLGFGADPVVTLSPAVADALGRGEGLVGLLASGFGLGAAAAFVLLTWLRRRLGLTHLGITGLACLAAGMGGVGLAATPGVAVAGMVLAGAGFSLSITGLTTQLYHVIPPALRGRIMALWSVAFLGSRPVAAAVNGLVADATSATTALLVTAATVATIAVVVGPRTRTR